MRKFILLCAFTFCLFGFSPNITAQHYRFSNYWSVSPSFGVSSFFGDLSNKRNGFLKSTPFSKYFYEDRQLMVGLTLQKEINQYFGVRGNIQFGNIKSTDESVKLYFTSKMFEYSLLGTADLTNLILGIDRQRPWKLYGFLGIGLTESHTWKYNLLNDSLIQSSPMGEGSSIPTMTESVLPFGLGFQYKILKNLNLTAEISRHYINSDKLDGVIYDGQKFEGFGYLGIGITYNFNFPSHIGGKGSSKYDGKSSDPSLRAYNKNKRVVMKTKAYNQHKKKRYNNGSTLKRKRPKTH